MRLIIKFLYRVKTELSSRKIVYSVYNDYSVYNLYSVYKLSRWEIGIADFTSHSLLLKLAVSISTNLDSVC